jgi:hypothetical protein
MIQQELLLSLGSTLSPRTFQSLTLRHEQRDESGGFKVFGLPKMGYLWHNQ